MDSVIRYLSKKVQPLKRCVLKNPSSSFECSPSPTRHLTSQKKTTTTATTKTRSSSIKRKFRFKLNMKTKRKREDGECVNAEDEDTMSPQRGQHRHDDMTTTITMNNATSNNTNPTNTLYLDSSSSSSSSTSSLSSSCSSSISQEEEEEDEYNEQEQVVNDQSSFFDHSLVTYKTSYTRESMAGVRQLVGGGGGGGYPPHSPIEQQRRQQQQSTPVMEQLNKLSQLLPESNDNTMTPSLKRATTISLHQNMSQMMSDSVGHSFQRSGSKCRRSNTLYTNYDRQQQQQQQQPSNKIIEYFSNAKTVKQANIRKLNPIVAVAQQESTNNDDDESYNEIDKLQKMFFNDDNEQDFSMNLTDDEGFSDSKQQPSTILTENDDSNTTSNNNRRRVSYAAMSQGQNSTEDEVRMSDEELLSYLETISCVSPINNNTNSSSANSMPSSSNSKILFLGSRIDLNVNSKMMNESSGSIERMRRSMSMPRLATALNCTDLSIKNSTQETTPKSDDRRRHGIETGNETSMIAMTSSSSSHHQVSSSLLNMSPPVQSSTSAEDDDDDENDNTADTVTNKKSPNSSEKTVEEEVVENNNDNQNFVRGGEGRMSKNIKKMFQSVINHQTNALISMERFYESQAILLEKDRLAQLSLNPSSAHKKINEYFDEMLRMLEERVQINLNHIVQQGGGGDKKQQPIQHSNHNLNQKLSQMILMKHIQQHSQNRESLPLRPQKLFHQGCVFAASANRRESSSTTISKSQTTMGMNNENVVSGEQQESSGEYVFKRNLSLPFRKHITPSRVAVKATTTTTTEQQQPQLKSIKSSPHLPKIIAPSITLNQPMSSSLLAKTKFIKSGMSPLNRQTSMKVTPSTSSSSSSYTKRQTKSISSLLKSNDQVSSSVACQSNVVTACTRRNSSIVNNRPLVMMMPPLHHPSNFLPIKTSTRLSDCHLQIRLRMAQLKQQQQQQQRILTEYETQV